MGMEILWFRHFSILLGGFRAVFSLLLTVILVGIGVGSLIGGILDRRTPRPAEWFMAAQGLFVVSTLLGLAMADARPIEAAAAFDPTVGGAIGFAGAASNATSGVARALAELWFNAKPILLEVGIPALLMGFSFPLANAIIQRTEHSVGTRAGVLYLANTRGRRAAALWRPAFCCCRRSASRRARRCSTIVAGARDRAALSLARGLEDPRSWIAEPGPSQSPVPRRCSSPPQRSRCGCCCRRLTSTRAPSTGCRGRSSY